MLFVSIELRKPKWKFGRMRNALGTLVKKRTKKEKAKQLV